MVTIAISGCYACPDPLPPEHAANPPVGSVEIIPSPVWARSGEKFTLRVRLKDEHGHLLPRSAADNVEWQADPNTAVSPSATQHGETAEFAGLGAVEAWITASVGGKSDRAKVTIIAGATDASDWATGDHVPAEPPRILLLDGTVFQGPSKVWVNDSLVAFVKEGPIGKFQSGATPGEITIFSRERQVTRMPAAWVDGFDRVNLSFTAPTSDPLEASDRVQMSLSPRIVIPITIWILDPSLADSEVDLDVDYAQRTFDQAWAGIKLSVTKHRLPAFDVRTPRDCPPVADPTSVRSQLQGLGATGFGPGVISIAYAHETYEVTGEFGPLGLTCIWNGTDGVVTVVNANRRVNSTLVHELGHAVGWLNDVQYGEGLDESNVMWFQHEIVPASRARLTLGQGFRLTLDQDGSFAKFAGIVTAPTYPCPQTGLADVPCPRLNRDVREP